MKYLSFNFRGLGGIPKKRAIHYHLQDQKPNVIFFQETMCTSNILVDFLTSFLVGWNFYGVDSVIQSKGLIIEWN